MSILWFGYIKEAYLRLSQILVKKYDKVEACPMELLYSLLVEWMCREQQLESSNDKWKLMCVGEQTQLLVHCYRISLQKEASSECSEAGKPWQYAVGSRVCCSGSLLTHGLMPCCGISLAFLSHCKERLSGESGDWQWDQEHL